jgi:dGTPase
MQLASYACHYTDTKGRLHSEPEDPARSSFQRDRDRIIHSAAFRRLEYKTQVFVNHEGDHYRTRLTHSLEVSQLARSICRSLYLDEDLAEALALAHDLGHTPFGHAGEDSLKDVTKAFGGFDHNAQTIRILTHLEQRYAEFDGLNLTWETLEGVAKHNGPVEGPYHRALAIYNDKQDLDLYTYASGEAQVAALADDIAYNNHDMEDGLRAGLFELDELEDLPLVGDIIIEMRQKYPDVSKQCIVHEFIRRAINRMVIDLIAQTQMNIKSSHVETVHDIRNLGKPLVSFSPEMASNLKTLKAFLMKRMYRHYRVNRMTSKARKVVRELFTFFHENPKCLPTHWQTITDESGGEKTAHAVIDFIAGMTDRFAHEEYARVFDVYART